MITEEIRAAIQKISSTDEEWLYGVQQCWNEETDILSRNINATIDFFKKIATVFPDSDQSSVIRRKHK